MLYLTSDFNRLKHVKLGIHQKTIYIGDMDVEDAVKLVRDYLTLNREVYIDPHIKPEKWIYNEITRVYPRSRWHMKNIRILNQGDELLIFQGSKIYYIYIDGE